MDRLAKERLKVQWSSHAWTRHSAVLLVAGLVYIALGYAYYQDILSTERQKALVVALNVIPLDTWGIIFMVVGALVMVSSKWPRRSEKWGYVLLTSLSSAWAGAYVMGILFGEVPITNIATALVWGLVAFIWWAISGLVNPERSSYGRS